MSIFFPYSPSDVLTYIGNLFTLDYSTFTPFETLLITLVSNLYFFIFWFIIIYFSLKIFNRIYERLF